MHLRASIWGGPGGLLWSVARGIVSTVCSDLRNPSHSLRALAVTQPVQEKARAESKQRLPFTPVLLTFKHPNILQAEA